MKTLSALEILKEAKEQNRSSPFVKGHHLLENHYYSLLPIRVPLGETADASQSTQCLCFPIL